MSWRHSPAAPLPSPCAPQPPSPVQTTCALCWVTLQCGLLLQGCPPLRPTGQHSTTWAASRTSSAALCSWATAPRPLRAGSTIHSYFWNQASNSSLTHGHSAWWRLTWAGLLRRGALAFSSQEAKGDAGSVCHSLRRASAGPRPDPGGGSHRCGTGRTRADVLTHWTPEHILHSHLYCVVIGELFPFSS